jgi:DNA-cytosine methyltransferase
VLSAEIDKEACKTYEQNFGENPYCDITQLSDVKDFDVLLAGFPCQAFSSAGKRLGFEDTRGTLFFDVARLIATKQPSMCVLENVRGLVSHNKGKTFETIKNVLSDLGYQFEYRLLNSSNYGVAQNRVRIYIVAVKDAKPILTLANDVGAVDSHAFKQSLTTMNLLIANRRKNIFGTHQDGKALSKEQIATFYPYDDINTVIESLLDKRYIKEKEGLYNLVAGNMSFEVFKFLDPDSVSITLTASDSNRLGVYHNGRVRRLTPRECARLQGFPDSYVLHPKDSFAYKQLGNAVSVPVIKALVTDVLIHNPSLFE